ncbi:MAG: electron transport complex subunit RsxD [Gammaproteobacteria bacterium]|nr:electron transport complex subunit RsxD [Gammaproteobacteria bacterium]
MSNALMSSPHGRVRQSTNQVMRQVMYATAAGLAAQLIFFGWGVLIQIALCVTVALLAEALVLSLREKPVRATLSDGSAILTGLLLALSIPPLAPWWIAVIGTAFSIIIVKQMYGGLGFNLFNPAMAGYVVLLISFPVAMTNWQPPAELMAQSITYLDAITIIFTDFTIDGYSMSQLKLGVDGISMATPLDNFKTQLGQGFTASEITQAPIYNEHAGIGWQWINLGYLAGGLWLLKNGIIRWHIPLSLLASLTTCSFLYYAINPDLGLTPVAHLLSGATMFAAFFIATDPVSASTTVKGRIWFGAVIGVLIFVIRQWGGYPDGVAFAVLLANMMVPLIDYYTKPTAYGHKARG